jgi:hypothetical protein
MSDSENTSDVQKKVTKEFRNNVLRWLTIDDEIRVHRQKVKELNNEKKEFEGSILSYLTEVEEDSIMVKDGKLSKYVSKSKAPLKKETIQQALVEITGDVTKASTLTEHILKSRPEKETIKLKRTRQRKKIE